MARTAAGSHPWDESFFLRPDELEFGFDGQTTTALAGTLVHLPAGTTHWFRFGKGGGAMLSLTSRLAASRMVNAMAQELSPVNPDLEQLAALAARFGMTVAR